MSKAPNKKQRDYSSFSTEELKNNKIASRLINIATILGLALAVFFAVWGIRRGIFSSEKALESFIVESGAIAPLIFFFVQIIQIVIPIIPGGVTLLASVVLFGPWHGFIYSYLSICFGSTLAFFLGRFYGRPFIRSIAKPETYQKYIEKVDKGKRFEIFFLLSMLFPAFPDDLICMLAGLTKMKPRQFLSILLLSKIPSIALYSVIWVFAEDLFWRLVG